MIMSPIKWADLGKAGLRERRGVILYPCAFHVQIEAFRVKEEASARPWEIITWRKESPEGSPEIVYGESRELEERVQRFQILKQGSQQKDPGLSVGEDMADPDCPAQVSPCSVHPLCASEFSLGPGLQIPYILSDLMHVGFLCLYLSSVRAGVVRMGHCHLSCARAP